MKKIKKIQIFHEKERSSHKTWRRNAFSERFSFSWFSQIFHDFWKILEKMHVDNVRMDFSTDKNRKFSKTIFNYLLHHRKCSDFKFQPKISFGYDFKAISAY